MQAVEEQPHLPTAKAGAMPLRASTVVLALAYVAITMPRYPDSTDVRAPTMKAMVEKMPFCSSSCAVRLPSGFTMDSSEKITMDMITCTRGGQPTDIDPGDGTGTALAAEAGDSSSWWQQTIERSAGSACITLAKVGQRILPHCARIVAASVHPRSVHPWRPSSPRRLPCTYRLGTATHRCVSKDACRCSKAQEAGASREGAAAKSVSKKRCLRYSLELRHHESMCTILDGLLDLSGLGHHLLLAPLLLLLRQSGGGGRGKGGGGGTHWSVRAARSRLPNLHRHMLRTHRRRDKPRAVVSSPASPTPTTVHYRSTCGARWERCLLRVSCWPVKLWGVGQGGRGRSKEEGGEWEWGAGEWWGRNKHLVAHLCTRMYMHMQTHAER